MYKEKHMNDEKTAVAVMFSGGTDSTYAAWSQSPNYDRIHLVTFFRHGLRKSQNTKEAFDRLKGACPDKEIHHHEIDFEEIYQMITPKKEKLDAQLAVLNQEIDPLWDKSGHLKQGERDLAADLQRLFQANECLQCKIAMDLAAIKFCLDNGISSICDGSNTEQLDDGSQLEDVKQIARQIFKRFGINYFSPVFHVSVEERGKVLFDAGITDHLNHKHLEKNHQLPSRQIQCTVPASVLWTTCIFPWVGYDGDSCNAYIRMSCLYFEEKMETGLRLLGLTKG